MRHRLMNRDDMISGVDMPIPVKPLIELIEESCRFREEFIALIYKDVEISYYRLKFETYKLANLIIQHTGKERGVVCVDLNREPKLIYAILAIQLVGCVYLPLSKDMPLERNKYMVNDSSPILIITDRETKKVFGEKYSYLDINTEFRIYSRPNISVNMKDISYIMYTSGSTGRPKGVKIDQMGICNSLLWKKKFYDFSKRDSMLFKAPINYDISMWEIFFPLICGGTLVIVENGMHASSLHLCEIIKKNNISFIHIVPEMLRLLLDEPEVSSLKSLSTIVCGGEAWYDPLAERCKSLMPWVNLYNGYGPTEASVGITVWKYYKDHRHDKPPIGNPIANAHLFIADEVGRPVTKGTVGELMIGGISVSPGYVNPSNDRSLEEKYFTVQFSDNTKMRFYKTGDLVRRLDDGNIEFVGRIDHQVKVNGTRIELEEIEHIISEIKGVINVVAVCDKSFGILVFYTANDRKGELDKLILSICDKKLPGPVVPTKIAHVDELPISVNGKVDRKLTAEKFCK